MNKLKTILKNEFVSGKKWYDWAFLAVGLALQVIAIIVGYLTGNPDSVGLIIAGLSGVVSVILCSQGKISFYIFAYVQLITYVCFFSIPNHLHGETVENAMYFISMIYGIYVWVKHYRKNGNNQSTEIKSRKLSWKGNVITASIFCRWNNTVLSVLKECSDVRSFRL